MQRILRLLPCLLLFPSTTTTLAQCGAGELEITIDVITDDWGNETYWQLVPYGNTCGQSPLFTGGNMVLNCSSAGTETSPAGGYMANTTYTEGPWCLAEGAQYSIVSIDSYGDNQASFVVRANGSAIADFSASGGFAIHSFTVAMPLPIDMGVTVLNTPLFNTVGLPTSFTGIIKNFGSETITDFVLNVALDGTVEFTEPITGVNLASGNTLAFEVPGPWLPTSVGPVELSIWASDINGQPDENTINDEETEQLVVNAAIPDLTQDYLALPPTITVVADDDEDLLTPRDLDFHPDRSRNELWVINKDVENTGGSTVKFTAAGEVSQTHLWQRDQNAWHFMSLPTAIAFGDNGNFSTCPGVLDANHNPGDGVYFTGPSLWSSDPAIYAQPIFGGLGSHLDMLHVTPYSQGIAHERWNRYWVVDGHTNDIVMHDFRNDHGPGADYHGDAVIRRYGGMDLQKDPNNHVVSHCVLDKSTGWLYVVDFGAQRVIRLDTRTGTVSGAAPAFGPYENYVEYSEMTGHTWEVVASSGLTQPAGVELVGIHLFVSDHATGQIHIYDISAPGFPEVGSIDTGAPGIMGLAAGYDGRIWFVNATNSTLVRIDPDQNVGTPEHARDVVQVYPNPTSDRLFLGNAASVDPETDVRLFDATGRQVVSTNVGLVRNGIDVAALAPGAYTIHVGARSQRVVIAR